MEGQPTPPLIANMQFGSQLIPPMLLLIPHGEMDIGSQMLT